jgi:hypothetical protein
VLWLCNGCSIYNASSQEATMWPDNETTNDLIGFQVHAHLILSVLKNPQMLPTTIDVFGG